MNLLLLILFTIGIASGDIVAQINDIKISNKEFNKVFHLFWKRVSHLSSAKPTRQDKRIFLIDYVSNLIVLEEAKKMGLSVSNKELRSFMDKYIGRRMREKSIIKLIKAEILTRKIVKSLIEKENLDFSESKLRAYYEFYKRDFYYPTSVKLLGVYTEDYKTAKKVSKLLKNGESVELEGVKVGTPLWYSVSALPIMIKRKLPSLSVGAVSRPIRVNGGYVIFKVIDKEKGGVIPFEKAKELIKKKIIKQKEKEVFRKWFSEVLKRYEVKFYWENL